MRPEQLARVADATLQMNVVLLDVPLGGGRRRHVQLGGAGSILLLLLIGFVVLAVFLSLVVAHVVQCRRGHALVHTNRQNAFTTRDTGRIRLFSNINLLRVAGWFGEASRLDRTQRCTASLKCTFQVLMESLHVAHTLEELVVLLERVELDAVIDAITMLLADERVVKQTSLVCFSQTLEVGVDGIQALHHNQVDFRHHVVAVLRDLSLATFLAWVLRFSGAQRRVVLLQKALLGQVGQRMTSLLNLHVALLGHLVHVEQQACRIVLILPGFGHQVVQGVQG